MQPAHAAATHSSVWLQGHHDTLGSQPVADNSNLGQPGGQHHATDTKTELREGRRSPSHGKEQKTAHALDSMYISPAQCHCCECNSRPHWPNRLEPQPPKVTFACHSVTDHSSLVGATRLWSLTETSRISEAQDTSTAIAQPSLQRGESHPSHSPSLPWHLSTQQSCPPPRAASQGAGHWGAVIAWPRWR